MRPIRRSKPRPWQLAAYLDGELAAADTAAVRRYLESSDGARQQLEQLSSIRSALSSSGREFDRVDLLPSLRARIREQTAERARQTESLIARLFRRPVVSVFAASMFSAAVCLGLAFAPRERSAPDFRAKSAGLAANSSPWAGVQAYRVRAGKPERLGDALAASDGLLFSYSNLGSEPLSNLMIFAIDTSGEVHWFHPAYQREGTNPTSISIEKGAAQVPLAELIEDQFPPGPLTIHALFSNRPLRVLEVEGWLKLEPKSNLVSHVPGSVDQVIETRIEP